MDRRKFIQTCGLTIASMYLFNQTTFASEFKRNPAIKPIVGSWFEFMHHNAVEGTYWNPALKEFTTEQWRLKVKEISEAGMEYLVLLSVADSGKTFYPSKLQPRYDFVCDDPLEAVLSAADEYGIKFFVSNDFWGDYRNVEKMMIDTEIAKLREKGMEEVAGKYGHHKSFYGWYFPNETGIHNTIDEMTINYVNACSRKARKLIPGCTNLIAPYGTKTIRVNDQYIKQLERLDIDIMAYQDEVGVNKTKAGTAARYYEALYKAHEKAGRARLWADIEVFRFEEEVYKSALLPARFERVLKQMEDISPYVENILIYQYIGMMNKPGSEAFAGHESSTTLYMDYMNWLDVQNEIIR